MELIDLSVEYPSGMTITDSASYLREMQQVFASERLQTILVDLTVSEAPPVVTALIDGATVRLDQRTDGSFSVGETLSATTSQGIGYLFLQPFLDPTKDQRQQFGRFCHTLAAAAFLGAVGVWHSMQVWTFVEVKLEASLVLSFVITFFQGMRSTKGE